MELRNKRAVILKSHRRNWAASAMSALPNSFGGTETETVSKTTETHDSQWKSHAHEFSFSGSGSGKTVAYLRAQFTLFVCQKKNEKTKNGKMFIAHPAK